MGLRYEFGTIVEGLCKLNFRCTDIAYTAYNFERTARLLNYQIEVDEKRSILIQSIFNRQIDLRAIYIQISI